MYYKIVISTAAVAAFHGAEPHAAASETCSYGKEGIQLNSSCLNILMLKRIFDLEKQNISFFN